MLCGFLSRQQFATQTASIVYCINVRHEDQNSFHLSHNKGHNLLLTYGKQGSLFIDCTGAIFRQAVITCTSPGPAIVPAGS
jgi:hypothetical protein